jgi:hypothetical protein
MIKKFFQFQISNFKFQIFFEETFYALTVSLIVFGILELIKSRIVLAYLNLNYLLLLWLAIGIILIGFFRKK